MEDFSVVIPDYLLNDNNNSQNDENVIDVELFDSESLDQEENVESQSDYSSILNSINSNLIELNTNIVILQDQYDDLTHAQTELLKNTSFLVYFAFAFFVVGALCLVIKFFKQFF